MKNYVKYTSEMDKTAAYPAYLEISNSLRQIMKYQLDMEYYTDVMEDRAAKATFFPNPSLIKSATNTFSTWDLNEVLY